MCVCVDDFFLLLCLLFIIIIIIDYDLGLGKAAQPES